MQLQCDLLELRDAHAKLRTTNEKLRREKERTDRDKDVIRQTSRSNPAEFDQKKMNYILDLVRLWYLFQLFLKIFKEINISIMQLCPQVSELSKTVPYSADKGLPPVPNRKQVSSQMLKYLVNFISANFYILLPFFQSSSRESSVELRNTSRGKFPPSSSYFSIHKSANSIHRTRFTSRKLSNQR